MKFVNQPVDTKGVARKLRHLCASRSPFNQKRFVSDLKDVLTKSEATRLWDYYYRTEAIMTHLSNYRVKFSVHEDHFNDEAVSIVFEKEPIRIHIGRIGKVTFPGLAKEPKKASEPEPFYVIGSSNEKPEIVKDLSNFSDEKLVAELRRRGCTVLCEKQVERVVIETISL